MEAVTYGAALLAASALAMNAGPAMRRTAAALVLNWLACLAAVFILGRVNPWYAFAAFDAVAALVVLSHQASRPQAVIGCIYIVQITVHLAYALVGSGPATARYLELLTGGGWLQIAVLAGGAIYGTGKRRGAVRGMGMAGSHAVEDGSPRLASGE